MSISGQQAGISLSQDREKEHHPASLLNRAIPSPSSALLTKTQAAVDQIVTDFSKNSTDWKTLASITAGGMAYQWAKAGAVPLRGLAVGAGLAAEVTAFETSHRLLQNSSDSPHLWRWEGRGGLKQGLISSFLTFGTLKGFGKLAEGQNLILQHGAQASAMVLGHQLAYLTGFGPKPEGSVAEQVFQAEAFNLQLGAGMSLGRGLAPFYPTLPELPKGQLDRSEGLLSISSLEPLPAEGPVFDAKGSSVSMMSSMGPGGGNGKGIPPAGVSRARQSVPPPKDPLLGQVIDGRYKILNVAGQGGMGTVYTCIHITLDKKVAMKVLRPDLARESTVAQRFLDEAKAATSIGSPHIIDVIDFGRLPDHAPYFVMEFLEGVPLSKIMEGDKPVPLKRMIPIAIQMTEGLANAHQKNIIHRDLKPGNIFLVQTGSRRDFVKILDFGIAKITNSANELTMAGTILGTPRYMSPEQAEGKRVDQRSDIYSFGVLLYKMASGKVPFDSKDVLPLLQAHLHEAPKPLVDLRPAPQAIPPGLDAIVMKCLAKNPADRYQSMEEVKADLEKLSAGEAPEALSERSLQAAESIPSSALVPLSSQRAAKEPTPIPLTPKSIRKPQNVVIVPPLKTEEPKSRWPLILGLFGLAGAGALAVAIHNGNIQIPWNTATNPAPTPPAPTVAPAPTTPDPGAPSTSPSPTVVPEAPPAPSSANTLTFPPPPSPKRKVEVTFDPADAKVFHGDKYLGTSGALIEVEDGKKLEVEVRRPGFISKKVTLNGSQVKALIHLEKEGKPSMKPHRPPKNDADPEEPPPPPTKYEDKFE